MAGQRANSASRQRILISMRTPSHVSAFILGLTMTLGAPLAFSQSTSDSAKQDMKSAGEHSKSAAKDTGRGVKKGTEHAYHSTKRGTKKAWNKTRNTTKGAVDGGKAGAKQPD